MSWCHHQEHGDVFGLIMHQGCAFDTDFGILAEVAVRIRAVCARCCNTCSVLVRLCQPHYRQCLPSLCSPGHADEVLERCCAAQVLNALAPLQQEQGDTSGADSMLKSSFTLSKNLHDLHSQVLHRPIDPQAW